MNVKPDWRKGYSIVFLVIFFSLLVLQLFVPEIALDMIGEKYLWRKSLISAHQYIKFTVGDRIFKNAVVGKDGWFFYTGELSLRNYQKNAPLNVSNIKKLVGIFNQLNETVAGYGGTFLVVVPPDKSTIYPQYMPDEIPVIGTTSSLDRLVERVNEFSDIRLLDLRSSLLEASRETQIYYKTDTHWNCHGAFYAYEEIVHESMVGYPEIPLYAWDDFKISMSHESQLDIAKMIDIDVTERVMGVAPNLDITISKDTDHMAEYDDESLQIVVNSETDLPTLMVFHDSFYQVCLNGYIEPSFSRTISIPYKDIEMTDMLEMIERERPDIVMFEFVERFMEYLIWHLGE